MHLCPVGWKPPALSTMSQRPCYCCATLGNALDAALNELGMLSTVTNIREQYLEERLKTNTNGQVGSREASSKAHSVPNSPVRGYQVVTMNPLYVTGVVPGLELKSKSLKFAAEKEIKFTSLGTDYAQEQPETAKCSKAGRVKLARIKHFKAPYKVPSSNLEAKPVNNPNSSRHCTRASAQTSLLSFGTKQIVRAEPRLDECPRHGSKKCMQRSKSLDDLGLGKLNIGEVPRFNITQNKEVDSVSQHLGQMKVVE